MTFLFELVMVNCLISSLYIKKDFERIALLRLNQINQKSLINNLTLSLQPIQFN